MKRTVTIVYPATSKDEMTQVFKSEWPRLTGKNDLDCRRLFFRMSQQEAVFNNERHMAIGDLIKFEDDGKMHEVG